VKNQKPNMKATSSLAFARASRLCFSPIARLRRPSDVR
jgi:hypothetical protein